MNDYEFSSPVPVQKKAPINSSRNVPMSLRNYTTITDGKLKDTREWANKMNYSITKTQNLPKLKTPLSLR